MRERFVCGAQTMSMPGPDTLEPASGSARNGDGQLFPPGQSEEAAVRSRSSPTPSPLTTFLTRSELVPFVLELEKSLLVSKEHNYAKAPDRVAVLQATTLLERRSEADICHQEGGGEAKTGSSRAEQCGELLNCCGQLGRVRRSVLLCSDESATSRHLRAVVGLQAALIREQQEQLYSKDRELASIRKDRDQLEARLERMERRLAVHQKRSTSAAIHDSESPSSTSSPLGVTRRHSRTESLIISERHVRSRSSSLERTRTRLKQQHSNSSTGSGTPILQDERKSARKRLRTDDSSGTPEPAATPIKRIRKPPKLTEIRTSVEYAGLDLLSAKDGLAPRLTANHRDLLTNNSGMLMNETLCPSRNSLSNNLLPGNKTIVVPSWELHPLTPLEETPSGTDCEDISDDVFLRRHKKHEEDEKRRKRWDLQRTRTLLEHQELLKKYNKKSGVSEPTDERKDKVTSFFPKLEDIEEIEILPTVAVSAFGHPLPLLKRSDFELPWFDLATREARENVRTTRSKARTSRTSAGSSDDV